MEPFREIRFTVTLKCLKVALLPEAFGLELALVVAGSELGGAIGVGRELVGGGDDVGSGSTVDGSSPLQAATGQMIANKATSEKVRRGQSQRRVEHP